MGHLAFAAAVEAIISNLLFRGSSIIEPTPEEANTPPLSHWAALGVGASHFFHVPTFLRPCRDKA
jgi:hypothetical protein